MSMRAIIDWRATALVTRLAAVVLILAVPVAEALAQMEGERYFDDTGHWVRGPFLVYYDAHGGSATFGLPITDDFVDENGQLMQYFQRARLEWHPEAPEGQNVRLGNLGEELQVFS